MESTFNQLPHTTHISICNLAKGKKREKQLFLFLLLSRSTFIFTLAFCKRKERKENIDDGEIVTNFLMMKANDFVTPKTDLKMFNEIIQII